jgi:hypothetical protein
MQSHQCDKLRPKGVSVLYTVTRLLPSVVSLSLWLWLGDGSTTDPANLLLVFGAISGVVAWTSVRRYWHIRNTSRSRRDSSLLA